VFLQLHSGGKRETCTTCVCGAVRKVVLVRQVYEAVKRDQCFAETAAGSNPQGPTCITNFELPDRVYKGFESQELRR
jgi:hypothetical protein